MYQINKIQHIKKQWLISFILYSLLCYLPSLIFSHNFFIDLSYHFGFIVGSHPQLSWDNLQIVGIKISLFCLVSWLVYFFTYKTGGIKLLSVIWLSGLVMYMIQIYYVTTFFIANNLPLSSYDVSWNWFVSLQEVANIFYIYSSYKLFCVNKYLLYKDNE